ncbi:MAG: radical SAM protein [Rhodospirillaceae bacterium]|nr:radical SAM protein [Rhodospirillaceae bacterium]MBT5194609.1 radical SAM protein [Rhodospirillaceae bacterium]
MNGDLEGNRKVSRLVQRPNQMTVNEALELFKASGGEKVQILRPFAVFSGRSYSTPLTVPIGPAYLAGMLEAAGYSVDVIDGIGEGIHNVIPSADGELKFQGLTVEEIIDRVDPLTRLLGVSLMFSQDWVQHRDLIRAIKGARPNLTIVVGGEHVTAMPEYVLEDCAEVDYLITGEGELTFLEFASGHFKDQDLGKLPGLCYRDHDGEIVNNGLGQRVADFANLPRPAWHLCNVENFFTGMWSMGIGFGRNILILATRGCPYQCTFCSNPTMWTTRYLMRPATDVVDEIEHLIAEYGANSFDFADLTAIVKKSWVLEFCAEIKRRKLEIIWQLPSGTRSEALDGETVQAIYDAGCKLIVYAPESGSRDTLRVIKKKLSLEKLVASVRGALKVGHTIKLNLIIGFPHERRRHIFETLLFTIRMAFYGTDDCNISIFSPYPGSELYDELREQGTIPEISDEYFNSLLAQFDFTLPKGYCQHVSGRELAIYRFLGMGSFYGISYLLHPGRLLRLVTKVFRADFQPRNLFEQRIYDNISRRRLLKQG